ncbi:MULTISPECIES: ABC transporter substrate-binding protein [Streptomycetaceae]|uniref:ABC transporter, substrate-binding protein n=1 Tax=Streptantibioticus cattleyicolor (strain ATCC 35852 / DSM 46488 / JCM 4925 / NBRC 14057 / NRRL 8057) TaxID=1003195 RepID=F8JVR2_STREN|nr:MULTISPECIES: ABC transporter substrate-binding protein [Streptomycetaceae]AEW96972.1 ABC transporter, substrate-binding protein [Streptantibioticus cattleyicolor NRRL 8057 = DSM 46488]MYS61442.1 ABC transporter substrate-binding protein [Streptomyces sp. SID5468]CCB77299.1 ABC transporter, substrate-binding protein [Streptantibioticus cattleyicolor NRRL 8057 = DSM 46488]
MTPVRKSVLTAAACALALSLTACGGGAAKTAPKNAAGQSTVRIMVGGLDKQIYLPVTLTQKLGYFASEGLDVRLSDEPAGVDAETAMVAGQVDAVVGFYDHTIDLQSKGKSTESVVQLLQAPGEVEMVRADEAGAIRSPADFKGRKLGVTGLGSSTNFLTQYLEEKNGVRSSEATSVAVGAGSTFVAAMKNKQIDAGMTTEPTISVLQRQGLARPLVDMRTVAGAKAALGGTYPSSCLYMTTDYIRKNPEVARKLAVAFVRTLKWIQGHSAAQIADRMPAGYYAGIGKELYTKALEDEKGMYSPDGLMPADGPRTVLSVLSAWDPSVKGHRVDLSKTYTDEFVKQAR